MMSPFRKSVFPVCGLLFLTLDSAAHAAETSAAPPAPVPWGIRVDIGYTYDDNVSRSSESKLADHIYSLSLSKAIVTPLSGHTRLLLSGMLGGEKFGTHTGLGRIFAGVHSELMYRASGEFGAPTWAVFGRAFRDDYQSSMRDGSRFAVGVSARKPVTDRVTVNGAVTRNVRNSESTVFDTRDSALRMSLDYELTPRGTLYVSGEHRRGDIVFSMKSDFMAGDAHQLDDVLTGVQSAIAPYYGAAHIPGGGGGSASGMQYFDYRMQGTTGLITLGYNRAFGSRASLDLSWRRIRSTPDSQPGYTPPSYIANQFSLAYLTTF